MTSYSSHTNNEKWIKLKDKLNYLKEIVDPRYLIESLGFYITKETHKEIRASCKIHGGDNTTGFRFNKDRRTWVCFTRRCHEIYGNDIISLIRSVNNTSFSDALEYLEKLCGYVESDRSKFLSFKRKRERENFIDQNNISNSKPSIVNEDTLMAYRSIRSDKFIKDGFLESTLNHFEIGGGHVDENKLIRDVIPIRDVNGSLMAYSLRDIRDNVSYDNKYILTYGFNKDGVIYNLNQAKEYSNIKPIILVEGFKSVWRLYEYGINNVAAVMGSTITPGQVNLLCSYALNGVVIMFDNDMAGVTGAIRSLELINNRFPVNIIFITETDSGGNGLDPADLSKDQIYSYLHRFV